MFQPEIKQTEAQVVAYLTMHGPYAQAPEGFGRLYGWLAQHGITPAGMPAAVYLTTLPETLEEDAVWELWAPLAGEIAEAEPDDSGVGVKAVPPMSVVSAIHTGPYETVGPTYEEMRAWITGHGYQIAGPPKEIYYSDPARVSPEEYVTEIQMPVVSASTERR